MAFRISLVFKLSPEIMKMQTTAIQSEEISGYKYFTPSGGYAKAAKIAMPTFIKNEFFW